MLYWRSLIIKWYYYNVSIAFVFSVLYLTRFYICIHDLLRFRRSVRWNLRLNFRFLKCFSFYKIYFIIYINHYYKVLYNFIFFLNVLFFFFFLCIYFICTLQKIQINKNKTSLLKTTHTSFKGFHFISFNQCEKNKSSTISMWYILKANYNLSRVCKNCY